MLNLNFGAKAPSLGRKIAVLSALAAIPCFATPIGSLSLANVTGGGVTVTQTAIDFFPPVGGGFGDFSTSSPTNISYNPTVGTTATVTPATNPYGQVKDINVGSGSVSNFIQFYTTATQTTPNPPGTGALQTYPTFDLVSLVPGGSNQGAANDCAGVVGLGQSCSPLITVGGTSFISPFVLTNRNGYVDVSVGFNLLGRDATGSLPWRGGFTTQLTQFLTASDVEAAINSGQPVTNSYSGTFSAAAVPEPATYGLLGSGMLLLGVLRRRASKK